MLCFSTQLASALLVVLHEVLIREVPDILVSNERLESIDNTDLVLIGLPPSTSIDISLELFGDVISDA